MCEWLRLPCGHACLLPLAEWEMRIVIIGIIPFTSHTQNKTSSWSLTKNFRKGGSCKLKSERDHLRGCLGNGILYFLLHNFHLLYVCIFINFVHNNPFNDIICILISMICYCLKFEHIILYFLLQLNSFNEILNSYLFVWFLFYFAVITSFPCGRY